VDSSLTPSPTPTRRQVTLGSQLAEPTRTHLMLDPHLTYGQWRSLFTEIHEYADSAQWWLADWWAFGRRAYRTTHSATLDQIEAAHPTLRRKAWVAARVPADVRRRTLSFTHHELVAALPAEEQRLLLDEAERRAWTTRELAQAIAARKTPSPAAKQALTVRAVGELRDLCIRAAAHAGQQPAAWAAAVLERAARAELAQP
jgi:hypothetical protein